MNFKLHIQSRDLFALNVQFYCVIGKCPYYTIKPSGHFIYTFSTTENNSFSKYK